jgi:hypothetical protein
MFRRERVIALREIEMGVHPDAPTKVACAHGQPNSKYEPMHEKFSTGDLSVLLVLDSGPKASRAVQLLQ